MSRKTRERRLQAEERWPHLYQFLGSYLHEDWPIHSGTPEQAVEQAVAAWDLEGRRLVLREWRDWNATLGWKEDVVSSLGDGFGVSVYFRTAEEARKFMNHVYDRLIQSVRAETSGKYIPTESA